MQEILHRYLAIQRTDVIQPAFDALLGLVDDVFPITAEDAKRAKDVVLARPRLSARDAVHLAVMEHNGVGTILTFGRGFDGVPGIARLA